MLDAINRFFKDRLQPRESGGEMAFDTLALASAALMFEVIRADDTIQTSERDHLRTLLRSGFDIADEDLDALEGLAEQQVEDATDLYQFTRLITEHCDADERIELIAQLWSLAWADGEIDAMEEHAIRRVAGLIHVRNRDFVAARIRTRPA